MVKEEVQTWFYLTEVMSLVSVNAYGKGESHIRHLTLVWLALAKSPPRNRFACGQSTWSSRKLRRPSLRSKKVQKGEVEVLGQYLFFYYFLNFILEYSWLCGSDGKEPACNVGGLGLIPGLGRSPGEGNGNPLQYSCLENSMDRGAWRATMHGVTKSWTWLSN